MGTAYSIRAVAAETGISAHTIRAWEKRYKVLDPARTATNRRVYSTEDIDRLRLLHRLVAAGHSIGMIAQLSNAELARLAGSQRQSQNYRFESSALDQCRAAVQNLDARVFENRLRMEITNRGLRTALKEVVVPLLREVGESWHSGTGQIAHEHLASAVVRAELERVRGDMRLDVNAPRLLVTTPSGHLHEMGALLVAVVAAGEGWDVIYLGPNLPAQEIGISCRQVRPQALALSLVFPPADQRVIDEIRTIRREIPSEIGMIVGGSGARSYNAVLQEVDAQVVDDLDSLPAALDRHRG